MASLEPQSRVSQCVYGTQEKDPADGTTKEISQEGRSVKAEL